MNYERLRVKFDREYPEIFYRMNTSKKYFNGDLVGYDWRILKIEHSESNSTIQTVARGFEYSEAKATILMEKLISKMKREDKRAKRRAWRNKKKEHKEMMPFCEWITYGCVCFLMAIMGFTLGTLIIKWILWAIS